jgi:Family of unknown function (DUF6489)
MKISIDIEATPDEVREFFGWPLIQPLQQELIRVMQENMNKGVAGFEPLSLMKSLFPMPMQGLENMQKVFSDAMKDAGGTKASEKAAPKKP